MKKIWTAYLKAFAGLPRDAWLLALIVLINRSGSMVLFFMTLYLTEDRGFTILTAGRILSIYGLGSIAGSYLGGWLTDRWGANRVQLYSLIFGGLGYIAVGYVRSMFGIAAMMLILALLADAFRPANVTAFSRACGRETRARGFALMRLAINLGMTIGPALGGFLALRNYRFLFWVDGLTCLIAAAFFWKIFWYRHPEQIVDASDRLNPIHSPWQDGPFLALMILIFVIGISFFQVFGTWPLHMKQICHLRENQIGLLLAINALMIVFIEMQIIHRLETQNPLKVIMVGVLFLFGGFCLLPVDHSYGYAAVTVVIWTIGEILIFPMMVTFIANRAGASRIGMYMGVYTLTFSVSMMLAPLIGSFIYDRFGTTVLWSGYGIVGLVVFTGLRLAWTFLRRERLPAPDLTS